MTKDTLQASADAQPTAERREEQRSATVFRPVLIEAEDFSGFCLVRNLSPNGMMGRVYTQFAEGTEVMVQFHPELTVSGSIIWSKEGQVGIEFDQAIDISETLMAAANETFNGTVNRAPRLAIQAEAEVIIEGRPIFVEVQDISQRGVKVRASHLRAGDEVTLCLEGLEQRKAIVRWCQRGTAGLNFLRPLSFDQLAEWVIWRQTSKVQADGLDIEQQSIL